MKERKLNFMDDDLIEEEKIITGVVFRRLQPIVL
jgi:hypothetical protein